MFPKIPMDKVDGMHLPVCDKCWTSSWRPCVEGTPNAVNDELMGGWMVCECCRLENLLADAKVEIQNLSQIVGSRPAMAWFDVLLQIVNLPSGEKRDKFIELVKQSVDASAEFISPELSPAAKYYGIIQEVVETLAEDGNFDRTIVAIRDELGSDLERYTSLEWHTEVDDSLRASSIMRDEIVLIDGHYDICTWDGSVFISATEGLCGTCKEKYDADEHDFVVTKWAYLPDTGWNKE